MTDEQEPHDLSPDEQEEVRRLLADAGGPVPTPPDVVARLDATLSRLVAERGAPGTEQATEQATGHATLTPLAVRRRRWPKVLLAAAAVVVGGYGVGAAVSGSMAGGESDSGGSGAGSADSATAGGGASSDEGAVPRASGKPVRISSADFDSGVARALGVRGAADLPSAPQKDAAKSRNGADELHALRGEFRRCVPPAAPKHDRVFPVRYDGKPATLVVGPERSGRVRAQVFGCRGTTLLRDSTVDLP